MFYWELQRFQNKRISMMFEKILIFSLKNVCINKPKCFLDISLKAKSSNICKVSQIIISNKTSLIFRYCIFKKWNLRPFVWILVYRMKKYNLNLIVHRNAKLGFFYFFFNCFLLLILTSIPLGMVSHKSMNCTKKQANSQKNHQKLR